MGETGGRIGIDPPPRPPHLLPLNPQASPPLIFPDPVGQVVVLERLETGGNSSSGGNKRQQLLVSCKRSLVLSAAGLPKTFEDVKVWTSVGYTMDQAFISFPPPPQ